VCSRTFTRPSRAAGCGLRSVSPTYLKFLYLSKMWQRYPSSEPLNNSSGTCEEARRGWTGIPGPVRTDRMHRTTPHGSIEHFTYPPALQPRSLQGLLCSFASNGTSLRTRTHPPSFLRRISTQLARLCCRKRRRRCCSNPLPSCCSLRKLPLHLPGSCGALPV
jgi:hypothetical protein